MKTLCLLLAGTLPLSLFAVLGACATNDAAPPSEVDAEATDAGIDAPSDASATEPCTDCEYFPEECSADVLCPNGLFEGSSGLDRRTQILVLRGRSENDVWAAGALGALAHFDGTTWTRSDVGTKETIQGLWLRDSAEVSLVSLARLYSRGLDVGDAGASPGGWTLREPPSFDPASEYDWWTRTLGTVWGAPGAKWLWVAMESKCWRTLDCGEGRRTSGLWRMHVLPSKTFEITDGIGLDLCQEIACENMTAVHGSSADELWGVGYAGSIVRIRDGESAKPKAQVFNSQTWDAFFGVWMASASEAWAVGTRGLVRHYTGHPVLWDVVSDVPTDRDLRAVWGSSPSDVWAVGDDAVVLHYDGKAWSRVKIAGLGKRRPKLSTVWVASPGHVWIGGQGVVLSLGGKP